VIRDTDDIIEDGIGKDTQLIFGVDTGEDPISEAG
jgi:hypothetical protein